MSDYFKIVVDQESLDKLFSKYEHGLVEKATRVVSKYSNIIARDSKDIIDQYKYRDTGRLINSIKPSVKAYADKVVGQVKAGTKYARFIHEGAKHNGSRTERFFVPFKVAPSLFKWAVRNKVIETIDGVYRLSSTGQVVQPDRGGLLVHIAPTKYFEKPYNEHKDKFVRELTDIIDEV